MSEAWVVVVVGERVSVSVSGWFGVFGRLSEYQKHRLNENLVSN